MTGEAEDQPLSEDGYVPFRERVLDKQEPANGEADLAPGRGSLTVMWIADRLRKKKPGI